MSHRQKCFLILTPGFPASEVDSTCLPMQQHFTRCLKTSYPDLKIIVLSFQYPYRIGSYQWHDVTVTSFNGQNKGGFARLMLRQKIYGALKKIHGRHDIVGLLSFWFGECAYVGKRFSEKHGLKHYCWLLGQDARKENKYPEKIYLKENELLALSDFLQDEFETNHGTRPSRVIPPGNDIPQTIPIGTRKIDILAAGSLIPLKRYDIYLEVLSALRNQLPLLHCRLVGDGPERPGLQKLSKNFKLDDTLLMTGEIPHADLLALMQQTKVFLHTSAYEGFSGVCLEALNAGAHVISFTKPMHQDLQQWHTVRSTNEMIDKSIELLKSPYTKYENQIIFKMEDTVKRIMELYK